MSCTSIPFYVVWDGAYLSKGTNLLGFALVLPAYQPNFAILFTFAAFISGVIM
jgi:hypothetical protein